MESAYDHIQEETLPDQTPTSTDPSSTQSQSNLNTELQDAYNSFSSSAWGARIGGFLATAKKQGETYIQEGRNQATSVGGEAIKGFTDLRTTLVSRARSMSQSEAPSSPPPTKTGEDETKGKEKVPSSTEASEKDENNPESAGFISRFKTTAEQGLRDLRRAEDAADEALLKFGGNIRSFLRDAVTIAPPSTGDTPGQRPGQILFESKDHEGKRVIHTTRFDAQLHVVHCSLDSFLKDPVSPEWEGWSEGFDVGGKTEDIARDLERYEELRRSMERCVPERVEYARFWMRYYFLRMVVESEERRRKEILKGKRLLPVFFSVGGSKG